MQERQLTLVERVARALAPQDVPWAQLVGTGKASQYRRMARRAIAAMRDPTDRMLCAVNALTKEVSAEARMLSELGQFAQVAMLKHKSRWQRMIDAALKEGAQ